MTIELNKQHYLGDGLYASFDGYHFILEATRDQGKRHWVALEPAVFEALLGFRSKVIDAITDGIRSGAASQRGSE